MKLNRLALAVLLAPMAAVSQAEITFTPFATYQSFDAQTFEQISGRAIAPDVEDKEGFGLSLGFRFTPAIGVEAHFARTETELEANSGDVRADRLSLDGYYTFNAASKFSPYLLLGVGEGRLKPDNSNTITDTIVNGGLGAFYRFTDKVALRMEAREVYNSDEDLNDAVAMLGLEFSPGNKAEEAAAEPQPEPEQAPVEEVAAVAAVVAIVDADNDGVADVADKCADTPAGVQVDADGCPLDGDKDGVADINDKCPTTAEGVVVDETGCDKMLTEAINKQLSVVFDSGKSAVKNPDSQDFVEVAALLKQHPAITVEIQGHTDASGKKASNDKLSQARADAVKDVLTSKYGVDAGRISAKGFGSSQPVADNKTAEGRAQNRRVVAIIGGNIQKVQTK